MAPRKAETSDAPRIAKIMQDWMDATEWLPDLHNLEETIGFAERRLIGAYETYVWGEPIEGFISVEPDNAVAALYVCDRNKGVGSGLLRHAKSLKPALSLWVFEANVDAIRFYKRHGFKEVRRTQGENDEGIPDILMEWPGT